MSYSSPQTHIQKHVSKKQSMSFWGFVCLMGMVFSLSPLAIDMYLPALPQMADFYQSKIDAMEASIAIYLLSFALGQLVFGSLADGVNKNHLLSFGLLGFAIASIIVALSNNLTLLYIGRASQGFLGGTTVVVFALIQQKYGRQKTSQIISYIMAVVVVAPMVAPMIGSQILTYFGWQWIFFSLGFFAFITLFTQLFMNAQIQPTKPENKQELVTKLAFKALLRGYKAVLTNPLTLSYMFIGAASFAGLFAFISGSPFVYMGFYQVSPQEYSFLVAINAIAMISTNLLNARLLGRLDATLKLIWAGMGLGVIGLYLFIVSSLTLPLPFLVVGIVLYVAMLGFTSANAIAGVLSSSGRFTGLASGLNGVLQFGLGALASTIISLSDSINSITMTYTMAASGILTTGFVLLLIKQIKKGA